MGRPWAGWPLAGGLSGLSQGPSRRCEVQRFSFRLKCHTTGTWQHSLLGQLFSPVAEGPVSTQCLSAHPPLSTDQDGDKQLSLPEFISLPVGTVENRRGQDIDDSWVRDRRKEFEELIDANHDGIVTMAELEVCGCPAEGGVAVPRGKGGVTCKTAEAVWLWLFSETWGRPEPTWTPASWPRAPRATRPASARTALNQEGLEPREVAMHVPCWGAGPGPCAEGAAVGRNPHL